MLNLGRLQVLREVVARGSFSAAAEALSYTQSAISQSVSRLEAETGAALVIRDRRGVRPTAAGAALVAHAETIFEQVRVAEADLAHVGHHADIAIGFIKRQWSALAARARAKGAFDAKGNALGWMSTGPYLELARRSMREKVVGPLRERGIPVAAWTARDDDDG